MRDRRSRCTRVTALAGAITVLAGAVVVGQRSDGFAIARDPEMFSSRLRLEFEEMNATFGDFGFEIEVLEGARPTLTAIVEAYGEPDDAEDVEITTAPGAPRVILRFHFYGAIGFGVDPDDPEQRVVRIKRREG